MDETRQPRDTYGPHITIGLGLTLFALLSLGGASDDFPNADIAGLAYEADLILRGGLPYVDTHELKALGGFWLWASIFATCGRSLAMVQITYALWLLLGAVAVALSAQWLYADRHRYGVAFATATYLFYAPVFAYNYSGWMMPAYTWAFAWGVLGLRHGNPFHSMLAGSTASVAYLLKHQAIGLGLALPLLWFVARRHEYPGGKLTTWLWWLVGAVLVLSIPVGVYAARGHTSALLHGLFPLARANAYRQAVAPISWPQLGTMAVIQFVTVFPLGAVMVVFSLSGVLRALARGSFSAAAVVIFPVASVISVALGGQRFFTHYLIQYVPALALMVGHPQGWLRLVSRPRWNIAIVSALILTLGWQLVEIGSGQGYRRDITIHRLSDGTTPAQAAGAFIQRYSKPDDTIQCWGWTAWPVYYWAHRAAPGPTYKPMGTVTYSHGSSAFHRSPPIHYRPGPSADAFLHRLQTAPPRFFVYSPAFRSIFGSPVEPLEEFEALERWIHAEYRPMARFGDLLILGHKKSFAKQLPIP